MKVDDFIKELRKHNGVPFDHQGRDDVFGLDCAGHLICAAAKLGHTFTEITNYTTKPSQKELLNKFYENGFYNISIYDLQRGDVVLFAFDGNIQHIAIVTEVDPIYISHAVLNKEVMEHRLDDRMKESIRRCLRYKNMEV